MANPFERGPGFLGKPCGTVNRPARVMRQITETVMVAPTKTADQLVRRESFMRLRGRSLLRGFDGDRNVLEHLDNLILSCVEFFGLGKSEVSVVLGNL